LPKELKAGTPPRQSLIPEADPLSQGQFLFSVPAMLGAGPVVADNGPVVPQRKITMSRLTMLTQVAGLSVLEGNRRAWCHGLLARASSEPRRTGGENRSRTQARF
jgi:hypothetical protein